MLLLFGMSALSIFPMDILLPAYPAMAFAFAKTTSDIAASISLFMLIFALFQLVVGPLSDAWGRQKLLLSGLALTLVSSIGCALTTEYAAFLVFRALQAVGCSVLVLTQPLIQEVFDAGQRQSMRIYLVVVSGFFISCSPLLGTLILEYYGWAGSFYLAAGVAALLIGLTLRVMPLLAPTTPSSPLSAFVFYRSAFANRLFILYWVLSGLALASHFSFIIVSPIIFLDYLRLESYLYSSILLAYGLAYILSGGVATCLARRISLDAQIATGFLLIGLAGAALLVTTTLSTPSVMGVLVPLFICTAGTTLCRPAATSCAMQFFSDNAGAAGAAGATVVFLIAAMVSALVSYLEPGLYIALALTFVVLAALGLWFNRLIQRVPG